MSQANGLPSHRPGCSVFTLSRAEKSYSLPGEPFFKCNASRHLDMPTGTNDTSFRHAIVTAPSSALSR